MENRKNVAKKLRSEEDLTQTPKYSVLLNMYSVLKEARPAVPSYTFHMDDIHPSLIWTPADFEVSLIIL